MGKLQFPDLPDGPLRDLITRLHELHMRAGQPSLSEIVQTQSNESTRRKFSRDTVFRLFTKPPDTPPLPVVLEVGRVLAGLIVGLRSDEKEQILDDLDILWVRLTQESGGSRPADTEARTVDNSAPRLSIETLRADLEHYNNVSDKRDSMAAKLLISHLGHRRTLPRMADPSLDALKLRVHPSHSIPGEHGDESVLPLFVPRERGESDLWPWLRRAKTDGGMLLLVGEPCVGKSRLTFEAARDVLGEWSLLAPSLGDGTLINCLADSTIPLPALVVWLDELHTFLPGPHSALDSEPVTVRTVERLLSRPSPVILLATMRTDMYRDCLRIKTPGGNVLSSSILRTLTLDSFSNDERENARTLAPSDQRLLRALADPNYNVTEFLAGARSIVTRFETSPEGCRAIVLASADANRLGVRSPVSEQYLADAARGYLTRVSAFDEFASNLREVTEDRRSHDLATAPLIPILNSDRSDVRGYTVADYLSRHFAKHRRYEQIPASVWNALIRNVTHPIEAAFLADSAQRRGLFSLAIPLFRKVAQRRPSSLFVAVAAADHYLDRLLARRAGEPASTKPTLLPVEYDPFSARPDETIDSVSTESLWNLVKGGDKTVSFDLARRLLDAGDRSGLEQLRKFSSFGYHALEQFAVRNGDSAYLMSLALNNDETAEADCALVCYKAGDEDGLRSMIDAGLTDYAPAALSQLLIDRDDLPSITSLSKKWRAASKARVVLLVRRNSMRGLIAELNAGTDGALDGMADLLSAQGRTADAHQLRCYGIAPDGSIADETLADHIQSQIAG